MLVTGSGTVSVDWSARQRSISYKTGVTGYKHGLAQVSAPILVDKDYNAANIGIGMDVNVNPTTGIVSIVTNDSGTGALFGFHGIVIIKYIFWN